VYVCIHTGRVLAAAELYQLEVQYFCPQVQIGRYPDSRFQKNYGINPVTPITPEEQARHANAHHNMCLLTFAGWLLI
jgi:hypothetical protein